MKGIFGKALSVALLVSVVGLHAGNSFEHVSGSFFGKPVATVAVANIAEEAAQESAKAVVAADWQSKVKALAQQCLNATNSYAGQAKNFVVKHGSTAKDYVVKNASAAKEFVKANKSAQIALAVVGASAVVYGGYKGVQALRNHLNAREMKRA